MRAKPIVLRVVPFLDFGGVESRVLLQARLAADEPYDLHVCALGTGGSAAAQLRAQGVQLTELGTAPSVKNPKAALLLAQLIYKLKPDILHSSIAEANFHALLATRLYPVAHLIVEEVGMPNHSRMARSVFRTIYKWPSALVGVTEAVCKYMQEADGAPATRLFRIYNCAHPRFFPERRVLPRHIQPESVFNFLHIGRLHPVKNQLSLIRAFSIVHAAWPSTRLKIVGDGPLKDQLRREIDSHGLAAAVSLCGFDANVTPHLESAHAFVLPSLSEGCSISLIEALAHARPAVGSDVPGIVEVLGHDYARNWTFPPNPIEEMATTMLKFRDLSPVSYADLAIQLQARMYQEFSPEAYMSNIRKLYEYAKHS